MIGNTYTEDGLVFGDLDSYAGGTIVPFTIEQANGTFTGTPGFSANNLLGFSNPTTGPTVFGMGRFGSMTITPPGVRNSVSVNVFMVSGFAVGSVTMNATLNGSVVASDVMSIPAFASGFLIGHLSISGVDFDQLSLESAGGDSGGASFLAFDSIVVETEPLGTNHCAVNANSTGAPAIISAGGTRSVHVNDLILRTEPVPNQPGLFYYGPSAMQQPFGDGFRCVGGTVSRLAISTATGNALEHALDISATQSPNVIDPDETFHFQAWFRDPAASGAGLNLSDAVEVTFVP